MQTEKKVLVFCDRDGTINADNPGPVVGFLYLLGAFPNWQTQIKFLPGVIEGIKILNSIPNTKVIIVSNQAGVALADQVFRNLTEQRMWEVDREIVGRLATQGARINKSFYCPYVTDSYAKKVASRGCHVHNEYLDNSNQMRKPKTGMLSVAANSFGVKLEDNSVIKFMIGDRISDLETGLAAGCCSFFILSKNSYDFPKAAEVQKLADEFPNKIRMMPTFLEVAKSIKLLVS